MSTEKLDENKIYVLKTSVPMCPDYQISEDMGQGLSEKRKKQLEKNINDFLKDYPK